MSTRGSWTSYKLQSFLELFSRYRSCCSYDNSHQRNIPCVAVAKLGHEYSMHQGLGLHLICTSCSSGGAWRKLDSTIVKDDIDKARTPAPASAPAPPPKFNFALWARWLLGSILYLLLPLWKQKWEKLQKIEEETEMVVEEIEQVAEVVEKVATVAEKVSTEVADKLPDHGKLKEAALLVERVSKATAHDAQLTVNFFQKVDALKQDIDELETMVEPIVDKIVKQKSEEM